MVQYRVFMHMYMYMYMYLICHLSTGVNPEKVLYHIIFCRTTERFRHLYTCIYINYSTYSTDQMQSIRKCVYLLLWTRLSPCITHLTVYKHVFAPVYKWVCLLRQTRVHEPYTLHLICTVHIHVQCTCIHLTAFLVIVYTYNYVYTPYMYLQEYHPYVHTCTQWHHISQNFSFKKLINNAYEHMPLYL